MKKIPQIMAFWKFHHCMNVLRVTEKIIAVQR